MAKLNFQYHHSSLQCHVILTLCSRTISYYLHMLYVTYPKLYDRMYKIKTSYLFISF